MSGLVLVPEDRHRAIMARWRGAGLAATGRLTEGPWWCWLTPPGMRQVGYPWEAAPPPLARLAHIRAVLAARMWLESAPRMATGPRLVAVRAQAARRPPRSRTGAHARRRGTVARFVCEILLRLCRCGGPGHPVQDCLEEPAG